MTTRVVFYSVTGHARAVGEGVMATLQCPLYELTDRFSGKPAGWKRASRRAVRSFDVGVLATTGVSFDRGDRLVIVSPYWGGSIVPAVSGFVRSVNLEGVEVFVVVARRLSGGDIMIAQLDDDIVRQGGSVGGTFSVRTLWRGLPRLRNLGKAIGRRVARKSAGAPFSLQELLGDAIEDEVEVRARFMQLAETTPNKRLKTSFGMLAAAEAGHAQMLQETYRLYSGTVYEPHRPPIAPLKPEQVSSYAAVLEELAVVTEAEQKAEGAYRAIGARYASQPEVAEQTLVLSQLETRHLRTLLRIRGSLSRRHA